MPRSKVQATSKRRAPLTAETVTSAAIALADGGGLEAVSMRRLASELGVEAMSLYNHVANKEQLFGCMVERVWAEVYVPNERADWLSEVRLRYLSAHTVVLAHPWVATLIESRRSGPLLLAACNAVLGCLRNGGFPMHLAYRALLTLDAFLYGFSFQEVTWPHARTEIPQVVTEMLPDVSVEQFPHVVAMMNYVARATSESGMASTPTASGHPRALDYRAEFEFGLDLVLQGLSRAVTNEWPHVAQRKRRLKA